ncbi:MAG: hypothetical protein AMJ90_03445 [candidate division Zixibacteria bacterium SM23_73_2]|nr:MAG: hypothetical protein AMJ90_03445 [candidate division Zixibacteria bacterium SM23_73_2]
MARKSGAFWMKIIDPENIVTSRWVRIKCQYGCGRYGRCLTCPPYSPTPEYTEKMMKEYLSALIMIYDIQSSEKERPLRKRFRKDVAKIEREMFLDGYYKAFGMACGPCNLCRECTLSYPCKYEDFARPSMEACGIDVYQTLSNVGYQLKVVRDYEDGCKFCSMILIE